jgi:PAT family beta-lactamase induction signal transducer AmpG
MISQSKVLRFSFFAMIYFAEGIILGYFASINALYMIDSGLNMTDVGIFSSIALIPFVLKIFFGMLSDKFSFFGLGHRKPYIVIGLLVQIACLLVVARLNPGTQYWTFVGMAFLLQLGMAFFDTCADGLALDITPLSEKGTLQGFMVGGRAVGVIVAASACGFIAEKFGWPSVFYFLAILSILPFTLLFFMKETVRQPGEDFNWKAFSAFKDRQVLAAAGVGLIVFMVIVGANQIINPSFKAKMELSLGTAGLITTIWGVGVTLGAIVGGIVMDKFGDKKAMWISMLTVAPTLILMALAPNIPTAFITAALFGVAYGISQASYFALAMKYTQPSIAASMYSILMAVTNVGQGIGLALSGVIADKSSYLVAFIVFAALIFLVVPFMPVLFKKTAGKITA